jgi:hypothetical protein
VKQRGRLPAINAAGKKIQRLLIFDNHPDSLRLVSRLHPDRDIQPRDPRGIRRNVILGLFLILLLIGAMFLPLLQPELFTARSGINPGRTAAQVASGSFGAQ